jgi:hypothetical protein
MRLQFQGRCWSAASLTLFGNEHDAVCLVLFLARNRIISLPVMGEGKATHNSCFVMGEK